MSFYFNIIKMCAKTLFLISIAIVEVPVNSQRKSIDKSPIISDEQVVIKNSEMNKSGVPWIKNRQFRSIDSVITVIGHDKYPIWINSRGNGNVATFQGPVDKPFSKIISESFTTNVFGNQDTFGQPNGKNPRYWIVNAYYSPGLIVAFVHVEFTDRYNKNTGKGRIRIAVSNDNGKHFKYVGNIMSPYDDRVFNVQGAPYIINNGFFYVYAKDNCNNTSKNGFGGNTIVFRARLSTVLSDAKKGKVGLWHKYHLSKWDSPGKGGKCTPINIDPDGIIHSDAAYSNFSKKFILAVSMNTFHKKRDSWIKLYESKDGINWNFISNVSHLKKDNYETGYQYVTIVNDDGTDNSIVGKKFYVYSASELLGKGSSHEVKRWTINLR